MPESLYLVPLVSIGVMALISAWGALAIDPQARVAIHWGLNGKPNRWASKTAALVLIPSISLILFAVLSQLVGHPDKHDILLTVRRIMYMQIAPGIVLTLAHLFVIAMAIRNRPPNGR